MVNSVFVDQAMSHIEFDILIDVRSPSEYSHAHIPGAINIPIFTDAQRAEIGTIYKQVSRHEAIKIGLQYFGPSMKPIIENIERVIRQRKQLDSTSYIDPSSYTLLLYCWRGGMRSGAMAWLYDMYGFKSVVINGGYKSFRTWVSDQFSHPYKLHLLSGNTGSNKTMLLHKKKNEGASIIDLEYLANHKGSAFGHIGMGNQPSQEMFENLLASQLNNSKNDTIWLEDECRRLGHVYIPTPFWVQMQAAIKTDVTLPFEIRLNNIVDQYGHLPVEELKAAIFRIQKKLGGLASKNAVDYLDEGNIHESFSILLQYYDKSYNAKSTDKHIQIIQKPIDQ